MSDLRFRAARGFSLERYVERHFPRAAASGDERAVECFSCGRDKLYVNVRKGTFYCFRCGARGTAFAFVREHEGIDDRAAARIISGEDYLGERPFNAAKLSRLLGKAPAGRRVESAVPVLPEGYHPLPHDTVLGRAAWRYLEERGVTADQIATHRIGVATRGHYAGCVILPVIQDGSVVYWVARAFMHAGKRYLYPTNGATPMTASEVLFNLDVASLFGRATFVEGYFDALAEGQTGVAMLGKVLSPAQLARVVSVLPKAAPAVVKHDNDGSVQLGESMGTARLLADAGYRDVTVARPDGKDPAEARGAVRDARPYTFAGYIAARVGAEV